tara:strand:+ start:1520 stop:1699 length:180 start_codon:yes stop_codon:yes gene_type:complete
MEKPTLKENTGNLVCELQDTILKLETEVSFLKDQLRTLVLKYVVKSVSKNPNQASFTDF